MRTAQCAVGPPFHRRPPAAKMVAPHTGGSQLVATESVVAVNCDPPEPVSHEDGGSPYGEPIMGCRHLGGAYWESRHLGGAYRRITTVPETLRRYRLPS